MNVNLKGTTFCLTGKLTTMTRHEALAAIEKAGGKFTKSVTAKTDYMIVGARPSAKYAKAKSMGIPLLTEEDFKTLMKGESVQVEEVGVAGSRGVDELLGEVRSVMQGAPSAQMWLELVELLDECDAEGVSVLTDYIDGYIARWSEDAMRNQSAKLADLSRDKNDPRHHAYHWYNRIKGHKGDLRVAPESWVGEMQQGVDSPKFKIVRVLDLQTMKLTSTVIGKLLEHPSLTQLESLILPRDVSPSKKLIGQIATHATLRKLYPGQVSPKSAGYFAAEKRIPPQLDTLHIGHFTPSEWSITPEQKVERLIEVLSSPMFAHTTQLGLSYVHKLHKPLLREIQSKNVLEQCTIIHVDSCSAKDLRTILDSPFAERHISFHTDRIACNPKSKTRLKEWLTLLAHVHAGRIALLDWSNLTANANNTDGTDIAEFLDTYSCESTLLQSVDTLVLGKWKTPELTGALEKTYPGLEVL